MNVNQDKTILHAFESMKRGKYNSDLELEIDKHYIKNYSNEIYKAATDKKYNNAYWMSDKTKKALKKNDTYPRWK